MTKDKLNQKIGILGGGQLGKMLCQAGSKFGMNLHILEKDHSFPAAQVCSSFFCGDITDYNDVLNFGKEMDIVTIEIENVNFEALEALEAIGIKVYPQTDALRVIKDKAKQKMFYEASNFPTSDFTLYKNKNEIIADVNAGKLSLPFVQKSRTEGYDGKGVHVVTDESMMSGLLEGPSIVEDLIAIEKEISVIVARNASGEFVVYQAVEMHFHPTANLVEYLFCPSDMTKSQEKEAEALALAIASKLDVIGLLAVEMFVTNDGKILVNEVAPRPHNSGHHTIEACITSQYEMHLRAILDLPLGSTELIRPVVMVNLLGEPGYSGPTVYQNIEKCLALKGVYPHLYGKKETKPFRKMGHVTIVDQDLSEAVKKAHYIQNNLKVIA